MEKKKFKLNSYDEFTQHFTKSINEGTTIPPASDNISKSDLVAIASFLADNSDNLHMEVLPHLTRDNKFMITPYYLLLTTKRNPSAERWDDPDWEPEYYLYGDDDPIYDYTAVGGPYSCIEQAKEDLPFKNESNADGKQWDNSAVKPGIRHYRDGGQEEVLEVELNDIIDLFNFNLQHNTGSDGLLPEIEETISNFNIDDISKRISGAAKSQIDAEDELI